MAVIGDVLYLKSGSQPMTVMEPEKGDSAMVNLGIMHGAQLVTLQIPLACLTASDPGPVIAKARADQVAALNPAP
jgi:hypothetical protein